MIAIDTAEPAAETGSELVVHEAPANRSANGNGIVVRHVDEANETPGRRITVELSKFELVEKMTRMLAHSAFVPKHLVDKDDPLRTQANCFRVALQAHNWDRNVFDVADRSYVTNGKLGYEGKLIASVVNTRAGLKGRLAYKYTGAGEDRTVEVSGTFRDESEPRTITLSFKQAKTNNEMWTKDPDQKLAYCGALRWARRHCPEVIDGVMSEEDLEVIGELEPPPPVDPAVEEAKRVAAEVAKQEAIRKQGETLRAQMAGGAKPAEVKVVEPLAGKGGVVEPVKVEAPKPVVAPVAAQPPRTGPAPITAETKAAIVAVYQASGMTEADLIRLIKQFDISKAKLSQLSEVDAQNLLWQLNSKEPVGGEGAVVAPTKGPREDLPLEVPVAVVAPVATPSSPQAETPKAAAVAQPTVTMSAAVLARLNRAIQATPNPLFTNDEQKKYLAARGVQKFNHLSEADALALILDLEAKTGKSTSAA